MVVRMVDGAKPQPPQKMTIAGFLEWVAKQKAQAREVISCYEAGPLGGVKNEAGRLADRATGGLPAIDPGDGSGPTRVE